MINFQALTPEVLDDKNVLPFVALQPVPPLCYFHALVIPRNELEKTTEAIRATLAGSLLVWRYLNEDVRKGKLNFTELMDEGMDSDPVEFKTSSFECDEDEGLFEKLNVRLQESWTAIQKPWAVDVTFALQCIPDRRAALYAMSGNHFDRKSLYTNMRATVLPSMLLNPESSNFFDHFSRVTLDEDGFEKVAMYEHMQDKQEFLAKILPQMFSRFF